MSFISCKACFCGTDSEKGRTAMEAPLSYMFLTSCPHGIHRGWCTSIHLTHPITTLTIPCPWQMPWRHSPKDSPITSSQLCPATQAAANLLSRAQGDTLEVPNDGCKKPKSWIGLDANSSFYLENRLQTWMETSMRAALTCLPKIEGREVREAASAKPAMHRNANPSSTASMPCHAMQCKLGHTFEMRPSVWPLVRFQHLNLRAVSLILPRCTGGLS